MFAWQTRRSHEETDFSIYLVYSFVSLSSRYPRAITTRVKVIDIMDGAFNLLKLISRHIGERIYPPLHNPENPEGAIVRRLIDFAKTIPRGRNFLGFMPFPSDAGARACTSYIHPRVKIIYGYWHATNGNYRRASAVPRAYFLKI